MAILGALAGPSCQAITSLSPMGWILSSFKLATKYVSSPWPFQLAYNGGPKGHRYMHYTLKKRSYLASGGKWLEFKMSKIFLNDVFIPPNVILTKRAEYVCTHMTF